jgi:hypothetical protein
MRIVRYDRQGKARLGVREGSEVIDRYGSAYPLASRCGEWELPSWLPPSIQTFRPATR